MLYGTIVAGDSSESYVVELSKRKHATYNTTVNKIHLITRKKTSS